MMNVDYTAQPSRVVFGAANPYWNPRPIGRSQLAEIRELLQHAYEGVRPDPRGAQVPSSPFEANLPTYQSST